MKIYLAARYSRREELVAYRKQLQDIGHDVQARWLNGEHQLANDGTPIGENGAALVEGTLRSGEQLSEHEQTERAAALRTKFALANKARVIVVGHRENIFHWLPVVEFCPTWQDALALCSNTQVSHGERKA